VIRRAATVVGGFGLLAVGLALLVLPGPGIPVLVAGLGLLSLEFEWARRLRVYVLARAARVAPERRSHRIAVGAGAAATSAAGLVVSVLWLY
jgi:hypothetical protein